MAGIVMSSVAVASGAAFPAHNRSDRHRKNFRSRCRRWDRRSRACQILKIRLASRALSPASSRTNQRIAFRPRNSGRGRGASTSEPLPSHTPAKRRLERGILRTIAIHTLELSVRRPGGRVSHLHRRFALPRLGSTVVIAVIGHRVPSGGAPEPDCIVCLDVARRDVLRLCDIGVNGTRRNASETPEQQKSNAETPGRQCHRVSLRDPGQRARVSRRVVRVVLACRWSEGCMFSH